MRRYLLFGAALVVVVLLVALAPALVKMDWARVPSRASWQLTEQVVATLDLERGARVADVGAGDGYFTFVLANAVGPDGSVFATDVEADIVDGLKASVESEGAENVDVVLGEYHDPGLPDGTIDVVFLCNVYHHIEDRVAYFARVLDDLAPGGRVVIIDLSHAAPLRWVSPPGHSTSFDTLVGEMSTAGYEIAASYDFLPLQNFVVFEPQVER